MTILELFAGSRSIGKAFEEKGHKVISIDWNRELPGMDWYGDIEELTADFIFRTWGKIDAVWASKDCATYSIARIWEHRIKTDTTFLPISDYAKKCDSVNKHVLKLLLDLQPKYWFIENPRGALRKMDFMQGLPRYTVTYCQYGDTRMKPTDIWTNHPNPKFKPMCKNGDTCHDSSPRGSTIRKMRKEGINIEYSGTAALRKQDRYKIPVELCRHIVEICEE